MSALRRQIQLGLVRSLNQACLLVDEVAYRPAVVKLTSPLPRWWNCQLAHASMKLDDHLDRHPAQLCGWCRLEWSSPPESAEEMDRVLASARERSVSWRWR